MKSRRNKLNAVTDFYELLSAKYGEIGTEERNKFEKESQKFCISEMLKDARKSARLTQSELVVRIGAKISYINKIDNGKGNLTIETLIRIFETGLNRKVGITIS